MGRFSTDDGSGAGRTANPRDEGAFFEPARVGSGRGRRIAPIAVVVVVGGIVAAGLMGRGPALVAPGPGANDVATVDRTPGATRPAPTRAPVSHGPGATADAGSPTGVALTLRPAGSHLHVHGELLLEGITVVIVSVEDGAGHVSAARSVEVKRNDGVAPSFDVQFMVADEVMGEGLLVRADAYGSSGRIIETVLAPVVRALVGNAGSEPDADPRA